MKARCLASLVLLFMCLSSAVADNTNINPPCEAQEKVVKNKRAPMPPIGVRSRFHIKEDLIIGNKSELEDPIFWDINSLDVDERGNIYALDRKACNVLVFDKDGRLIRRIGRRGQGPGELIMPVSISMQNDHSFIVYDLGNARLTGFSTDGEYLRQWNTASIGALIIRIAPDRLGNFYVVTRGFDEKTWWQRLTKLNQDLEPISVLSEISFPRPGPNIIRFYEPSIFFSMIKREKIVWGEWHKYELFFVEPSGALEMRVMKDTPVVKVSQEDRDNEIYVRYGKDGLPEGTAAEFPEYQPKFRFFGADDEGYIFVRTNEMSREKQYYYDIFDPSGLYIAKTALPHRPAAMKNNKLYTIDTNNEGLQVIKRYVYEWK